MSVARSVTKGVTRPVVNSIVSAIRRYLTTLTPAGSMHFTIPALTLTGDYKIKTLVYFIGSSIPVIGRDDSFQSRTLIPGDGSINWRPENSNTSVLASAASVPVNKLSVIEVERIESNGTIKVNDSVVFSGSVPTGTCTISAIGRNSSSFGDGIIANTQIFDAGVLSRFYKGDEDFSTTSVLHDSSGNNQHGSAINITTSKYYTRFNNVSPNEFISADGSTLEIAGT